MVSERTRARILAVLLAAVAALGPLVLASGGWSPPRWFGAMPAAGQDGVVSLPGVRAAGTAVGAGQGALGRSAGSLGSGGVARTVGVTERGRSTQARQQGLPDALSQMPPHGGGSLGPQFLQSCGGAVVAAVSRWIERLVEGSNHHDGGSPKPTSTSHSNRPSRPSVSSAGAAPLWWKVCPVRPAQAAQSVLAAERAGPDGHGPWGSKAPGHGQPWERGRFEWWNRDRQGAGHDQTHGNGYGQGDGNSNGHGNGRAHDEGHHWGNGHGNGYGHGNGQGQGHGHGHGH